MVRAVPTGAEPRPAELPLPGGREGATVRIRPLLCGQFRMPPAAVVREDGRLAWRKALGFGVPRRDWIVFPVVSFLVDHPGAGAILVDTGLHPSVAVDPKQSIGRPGRIALRDLEMKPDQAVPAQLRALGRAPSDVKTVVMTHLHIDHASAMSEFPGATFVFSRAEWDAATTQGSLHGYEKRQFDHAFDYRTLDFDGPGASSYSTFGRAFDLFGDGSVRLVFTPGHTLGHLSVMLRCKKRETLLAGDAIYLERTLREKALPHQMEDEHLFRRSLREIELYARESPDAAIVPGHDIEAWHRLPPELE
jgi:N-acyl homoserine lactone hydrolase